MSVTSCRFTFLFLSILFFLRVLFVNVGAVGFWKQATEVTSDIVNIITKPEEAEDDFRFPRTEGYQTQGTASKYSNDHVSNTAISRDSSTKSNPATGMHSSNGSARSGGVRGQSPASRGNSSGLSSESWDNLDDLQEESPRSQRGPSSQSGRSSAGIAAAAHSPTDDQVTPMARPLSGLSLQAPSGGSAAATAPIRRNTSNTSTNSNSNNSDKRSPPPAGDDFFANFGI